MGEVSNTSRKSSPSICFISRSPCSLEIYSVALTKGSESTRDLNPSASSSPTSGFISTLTAIFSLK